MGLPYVTVDPTHMTNHLRCGCLQQKLYKDKYPQWDLIEVEKDHIEVECDTCGTVVKIFFGEKFNLGK